MAGSECSNRTQIYSCMSNHGSSEQLLRVMNNSFSLPAASNSAVSTAAVGAAALAPAVGALASRAYSQTMHRIARQRIVGVSAANKQINKQ
jgi:hypothetical protein